MAPRKAEMSEGPEAMKRFRDAARKILSVPKSALPPDPFSKPKRKRKPAR